MSESEITDWVPHPRFKAEPYHSLPEGPPEEVFGSYWRYGSERTFSESAIKADVSKQNYSMFPR
ncbi:MAG: hypothetical protein AB8G99_23725, partial [Planctomycetaceae bacterium]